MIKYYAEKKKYIEDSLKENKSIPHSLRGEAKEVLDEIIYETPDLIDEPLPRVVVTTSHNPSSKLKSFSKHLSLIFNACSLSRGRLTNSDIISYCNTNKITHLFIVNETKGNPSTLIFNKFPGITYKFSLYNLKSIERKGKFSENCSLILKDFESEIGKKLKFNLSLIFPKCESRRVLGIINEGYCIAFRHYLINNKRLEEDLSFDLRLFEVFNSNFDTKENIDFVLNSYTNTRKENIL